MHTILKYVRMAKTTSTIVIYDIFVIVAAASRLLAVHCPHWMPTTDRLHIHIQHPKPISHRAVCCVCVFASIFYPVLAFARSRLHILILSTMWTNLGFSVYIQYNELWFRIVWHENRLDYWHVERECVLVVMNAIFEFNPRSTIGIQSVARS